MSTKTLLHPWPQLKVICTIHRIYFGEIVGFFYGFINYMTSRSMLYPDKNIIKIKIQVLLLHLGWKCPIISILDWECSDTFTQPSIYQPLNVTCPSLVWCYYHGKISDGLHSVIPPIETFTGTERHVTYIGKNRPLYLISRNNVLLKELFLSRIATLWDRPPKERLANF